MAAVVVATAALALASLCASPSLTAAVSAARTSYIGGAVQFTPSGAWNDPPLQVVADSIDRFESFLAQAHKQSVDVLVFPEGALGMFNAEVNGNTRDAMLPYCVEIGEVDQTNPCEELSTPESPARNSSQYQLWRASCLARDYSITLAVNLCETRACTRATEPNCPDDGRWQWNTNVVFSPSGLLRLKYHKAHLFGGSGVFDQAAPVPTTFVSDFGVTFGSFICFDIEFAHPAKDLIDQGITNFLFSSYWINPVPTANAIMQQQAFSRLYGVNLIAANIGAAPQASGGGIYSQGNALATLFNSTDYDPTGVNQLLVAELPILPKPSSSKHHPHDQRPIVEPIHPTIATRAARRAAASLPSSSPSSIVYEPCAPNRVFADGAPANCTLFTPGTSSAFEISQGDVTCVVDVRFGNYDINVTYIAFAYDGVQTFPNTPDPLALQICGVQHCVPTTGETMLVCDAFFTPYIPPAMSTFAVDAKGMDAQAIVFPMLSIDDGQVVRETKWTAFTDTNNSDDGRRVEWRTAEESSHQWSLFAAHVYAVRPNKA